jgi:hypothetical protein
MNFNFCRFSCGKSWHPTRIIRTSKGEWFVVMNDIDAHGECSYVRIEPVQELFDNPPEGWFPINKNELLFEHGNAEDALWKVKLFVDDTACPYVAEHTMYDIQHEKRIDDWKEKEALRMAMVQERMKMHEERENAKADC